MEAIDSKKDGATIDMGQLGQDLVKQNNACMLCQVSPFLTFKPYLKL